MSLIRRRRWIAGLILGLGPAASSGAQDLPPALPDGPGGSPPAPAAGATPIYRPDPIPVIVERTPEEPALAESRRYAVLAQLARGPMPVTSDRVLIGVPKPVGLTGSDAQIIAGNSLGRTQGYGPPIPINSNGVNSPS